MNDLSRLQPPDAFTHFVEVVVPGGFSDTLTYGLAAGETLERGSVGMVTLGARKSPELALVLRIHDQRPVFRLKPIVAHPSGFRFAEAFLEMTDWCGRFYCSTLSLSLDVFWPADLDKWLGQLTEAPKRAHKIQKAPPAEPELAPPLTVEQVSAMAALSPLLDGSGFRGALLHGVTGSGKTRVYLELAKLCLDRGQNVLILVPEIALTPQTRDRFQRHLHEEVLLLHSNLPAPERRRSWTQLLQGKARVVMGTRSAILAAGLNPGLIIIDEEHDSSYKQQDPAPRYHCRELAFHLAHRNGAMVVLGSATPSLESWEYAQRGHLLLVQLKERARPLPLPKVRIVDLRKEAKQDRELTMSPPLREALSDTLAQGHQAIILHNRRGYATSRVCTKCGDTLECQSCKVPLILHRQHNALLCHYCGRIYPIRTPCPKCRAIEYQFEGSAIEKVEQEILAWIPDARIVRMDRDTVQNIGAAEKILSDFRAGTYNILLGTQMVAKGHDFPNVQLVGVISADIGAALPDFRAGERSFQLLTQVAGRAGRAYEGGKVILQSWNPTDAVFQFAMRHDYEGFARWELANRKELQYPPFSRLLAIEVTGKEPDRVESVCTLIEGSLQAVPGVNVLGPADAYVAMIRGQHRKQFLLKGATPQLLRHAAQKVQLSLASQQIPGVLVKFDMDPVGML